MIYTHDEAARLIGAFEAVLYSNRIKVPSPEDEERESDNDVGLYGSVYSDLLDKTEDILIETLDSIRSGDAANAADTAREIIELFDCLLSRYEIKIPSPEGEEHEWYSVLIIDTEEIICELISKALTGYIPYVFSGKY